jgi:hypothetical protein
MPARCGRNSMVEFLPSKQATWVRFPSPAPFRIHCSRLLSEGDRNWFRLLLDQTGEKLLREILRRMRLITPPVNERIQRILVSAAQLFRSGQRFCRARLLRRQHLGAQIGVAHRIAP